MEQVTLKEAKEHLDELMQRAAAGEDVRIVDAALGTVKLTPVSASAIEDPGSLPPFVPLLKPRVPGRLKGLVKTPARLMEPMSDAELSDWYGENA